MYLDNQVIGRDKGFSFEVVSHEDDWGRCVYRAVISHDRKMWVKKLGFNTHDYWEACQELEYYMLRGFRFGEVEYKPSRKVVSVHEKAAAYF